MMKSFFKKLAFVMALAMVITAAAPAAKAAVAADKALAVAYQNGMAITEVNLANVGDAEDLRFLYAPTNWKELGVKWTSSNENVATVDSDGIVTAIAAGTAVVSVAVGTETASVTVNVKDLPAYTVSIGLGEERSVTEKELEIGESVDFAFYGIKDYSRDKVGALPRYLCTWQSDDTTVLTKDDEAGKFTAVKEGTAKVTLTVANVLTGQTHNVIPVTVTVKAPVVEEVNNDVEIVTGRNKTQNTVEIELPKAGSLNLTNVELFRVFFADDDYNGDGKIDERDIDEPYEHVYINKVNGSGTNWTLETFDDFVDGVTYEVQVAGYDGVRFVASVGDVANVVVLLKDGAYLATEELALDAAHVDVKLYDKNMVDVTNRKINGVPNNDSSNVTFWLTEPYAAEYAMTDYNEVEFYEYATAYVMATYENGVTVDSAEPLDITPETQNSYDIKEVVTWTLVKDNAAAKWSDPVTTAPAGAPGYTIATLLMDSRGDYFTTHQGSAGTTYNGKTVYYTEDETKGFWIHGYRAEYRAMNPDKMLVEDYGDIASYETGKARYALYLYNQFKSVDEEFVKELYSQYVNVCHPYKMTDMTATAAVKILTNTEYDENDTRGIITTAEENAYYNLYSVGEIAVDLKDVHGGPAVTELLDANFELTLLANADNAILQNVIAKYQQQLNDCNAASCKIKVEANDFVGFTGSVVKFTIKETVTGVKRTVTITLTRPVLDIIGYNNDNTPIYGESAAVGTIDEYYDKLGIKLTFEKFAANTNGFSVAQAVADASKAAAARGDFYTVLLEQLDKSGRNAIGVDNNIFVANTLNPTQVSHVETDGVTLQKGDRILVVKGPDGKVYAPVGTTYANPDYANVPAGPAMPTSTDKLGVEVVTNTGYATSASAAAAGTTGDVDVREYKFVFRAVDDTTGEIVYAKDGRYTVTIKTVKALDGNTIVYTQSAGLSDTFTITVADNNAVVKYAGRDLTRVEDASITGYGFTATASRAVGTDAQVKELIIEAFNFNLDSAAWAENWVDGVLVDGNAKLSAEDILYYTYTVTPTNKQVVINDVVFAVPSDAAGAKKDAGTGAYGWYRSTATVNKSLTFDYE